MSDIHENLEKIKNAVWGKDVRQAIHDSIHDCYEDGRAGGTDLIAREMITAVETAKADKVDLAEEVSTRSREIAVERSRVDNLVAKLGSDEVRKTLWTGVAKVENTTIEIDGTLSDWDYLDFGINIGGRIEIQTVYATAGGKVFRSLNLPNDSTVGHVYNATEMTVNVDVENNVVILTEHVLFKWDWTSTSANNPTLINIDDETLTTAYIYQIDGRKIVENVETSDIRIGADGTVYDTAGEAVRGQIDDLKSDFTDLNKFDITFSVSGLLRKQDGTVTANANYACTDYIDLTGIIAGYGYVVKSFNNIAVACLYGEAKEFISSVVVEDTSLTEIKGIISDFGTARYIRFCSNIQSDYSPSLYYVKLGSIGIKGEAIEFNNITFKTHDERTNLIDSNKCTLGYVNGATDGSIHSSTTMYVTPYIALESGKEYYFNTNYLYRGYCAFYDESKEYISGIGASNATTYLSTPFTTPEGTAYGRFTITSESSLTKAWLCETNQMAEKPANYAEKVVTEFIAEKPTDYTGDDISVFTKILCIGDSLTDGFFNETNGSRLIMRNRSYPTKLQALTGVECTNLGYAGYTSVQWYDAYQNEDISGYDACIIQLGVNDALKGASTSDTQTAFNNIVAKVKAENNGIKIFVATIPPANGYMTTTMRAMSATIRNIVEALDDDNVYLVDLWNYGHTDDLLAFDSGHLSAYGYLQLAMDYKAYISYIIRNNPNDFRYVQFIGTEYTFNGDAQTRQIKY